MKNYKKLFSKDKEELQEYFAFRKKSFRIPNKKGKGSYKRKSKYNQDMLSQLS